MIIRLIKAFTFIVSLLFAVQAIALPDSKGTEFVFAFQNNHPGSATLLLFITGEQDTQGVVEVPGYEVTPGVLFSEPFTVVANQVTTVELPTAIRELPTNGSASLGVHLLADDEVTVYGVNLQQFTTDAFLALPVDVLSNEYVSMSYDGLAQFASLNLSSQVAIVANADNTLVEITPTANVGINLAGVPFSISLNRFEVYQLSTNTEDLTGTVIRSSDPVAVMGGQKCADVPSLSRSPTGGRIGWCDHLVEMMPPLNTWGQSFAVIPLATRLNGSIVRILAAENGTRVKFGAAASDVSTLNQGDFFETVLTDFAEIVATGPVLVTQYSPGQAFDNVSTDPFMMLIPPNEQFLQSYTFATPENSFAKHFVNIAVPTSAIDDVLLDGVAVEASLFSLIGGSGLSGAQIPLIEGSHTLTAGQPFGIYVYGFNSYDSYGYPGGMALAETNPLGDIYAPNIGTFRQIGKTLIGTASDSEDINVNGVLDAGEDVNNNGVLDRRTEDTNSNGVLDAGEDINANGVLDRDRGVFKIDLLTGSTNLTFEVTEFVAGQSPLINFKFDLVDASLDGSGRLRVEDLNGNATEIDVFISSIPVLSDVKLISTVSGDRISIDQSSFTHVPRSVIVQPDKTVIEWQFDSFPANQIEDIGFDITLLDPQAGELRPVTQRLQLSYINALGGQRINTELGPQFVSVKATAFSVNSSTDKPNYGPNDDVQFSSTVTNIGTANNSGNLEFFVEDGNGNSIVSFTPQAVTPLTPGLSESFSQGWNTGLLFAGTFQLRVALKDDNGMVVNQTITPFSIVNSTIGLPFASVGIIVGEDTGGVFIEKSDYHTSDLVQIQSRISNISQNTLLGDSILRITVLDPNGQNVFSQDQLLNTELLPGVIRDFLVNMVLDNATAGTYQVQAVLIDSGTSAVLASSNKSFNVVQDISLAVEGDVTPQFGELLRGEIQTCTYTLTSRVSTPITDLAVRQLLINISAQAQISSRDLLIDLLPGQSNIQTHEEISAVIPGGDYACVLQVNTDTGFSTLGYAPFTLFKDVSQSLIGNVSAQFNELLRGDMQVCTYTLSSRVSSLLAGLSIHQALVNTDTQFEVSSRDLLIDVQPGLPTVDIRNEDTGVAALEGNFACEFKVTTDTGLTSLGVAPFIIYNLIADAGPDQTALVGEQVTLNASGSRETDGLALIYKWRFVSIPQNSNAVLSDVSVVYPEFFVDQQGTYVVELIVNNGAQDSLPELVTITVPNRLPVADAGPDQSVSVNQLAVMDGTDSFDLDGDPLLFNWAIVQKPASSVSELSDTTASSPTILIDIPGVYRVQLITNDGFENSLPDTVLLNVGNVPPVADAGENIVALIGDSITLDGSSSSDANGDLLEFGWFFQSKPAGSNAALVNTATARPFFTIDLAGDYVASLIVNDGIASSAIDSVTISVGNAEPVANAGIDQSGFVGDLIQLDGSASNDLNADPLTYRWNMVSKPVSSNAQLTNPFTINPSFVVDVQGDYIVQLIVNDGTVDSPPDTVFVTGGNLRPIANADSDAVGNVFTGATINLDGTFSFDPDGDPITYQWTFIDKPDGSVALFDNANSSTPSFYIDEAGDYIVQLVVNDGQIDSESASVFIEGAQSCIDNLAIRPKFNKIALTWDFNPDVPSVEVERATNIDGPYTVIANSTSTYATYLDVGLAYGPVYYYRIRGEFELQENIVECQDVGEGVICGEAFCSYEFTEDGAYLQCGDEQTCEILEENEGDIIARCDSEIGGDRIDRCSSEDEFCDQVCDEFIRDPEFGELFLGGEGETDFDLCLPPATEQRFCQTQIIASTPIGRIRAVKAPDVIGMTVEQAQLLLQQNRFLVGNVTFERTTSVPAGQVVRQDVPRDSVMPPNTAIDLVISTHGAQ